MIQVEGVEVEFLSIVEFSCLYLRGEREQDEHYHYEKLFHLNYPIVNSVQILELTAHPFRVILGLNSGESLFSLRSLPDFTEAGLETHDRGIQNRTYL